MTDDLKDEALTCRVPTDLKRDLELAAAAKNISRSALVREILARAMGHQSARAR